MKKKKTVKLGILGMGVVGTELVSQILKNFHRIEFETGITMVIEKIYVRSLTKKRSISTKTLPVTSCINNRKQSELINSFQTCDFIVNATIPCFK